MLSDLFAAPLIKPDTETTRTCGCCLQPLPPASFYTDGKDRDGNIKYRRDCKDCYKTTRNKEARAKKEALKPVKRPPARRKKK